MINEFLGQFDWGNIGSAALLGVFIGIILFILGLLIYYIYYRHFVFNLGVTIKHFVGNHLIIFEDRARKVPSKNADDKEQSYNTYKLWKFKNSFPMPPNESFCMKQNWLFGKRKHVTLSTRDFEDFKPVITNPEKIDMEEIMKDWKVRNIWKMEHLKAKQAWGPMDVLSRYGHIIIPAFGIIICVILLLWNIEFAKDTIHTVSGASVSATENLAKAADHLSGIVRPQG